MYDAPTYNWEPYGLLIRDRSSMASKGIMVSGGVVDAGYRGEILVLLTDNMRRALPYMIRQGDKIAQLIPIPVTTGGGTIVQEELPSSKRGVGGFGSTGV
jgi:dUTP pyrophosphatase